MCIRVHLELLCIYYGAQINLMPINICPNANMYSLDCSDI